jgi:hypothetical protein
MRGGVRKAAGLASAAGFWFEHFHGDGRATREIVTALSRVAMNQTLASELATACAGYHCSIRQRLRPRSRSVTSKRWNRPNIMKASIANILPIPQLLLLLLLLLILEADEPWPSATATVCDTWEAAE